LRQDGRKGCEGALNTTAALTLANSQGKKFTAGGASQHLEATPQ
jgi:hypothetical protein